MTVTMTAKHQITIPKRIADVLGLEQGAIFEVKVCESKIVLTPLETVEKIFPADVYEKLDAISTREKGEEKRVTKKFISNLKQGNI